MDERDRDADAPDGDELELADDCPADPEAAVDATRLPVEHSKERLPTIRWIAS